MTGTVPVKLYNTALVFEPAAVVPEGTTARFETSGSSTLAGDVPAGAVIKQLGGSGDELYAAADFVNRGTIQLGGTSGFNATLQVEGTLLNRGLIHGLAETSPLSMYVLRLENEGTLQADRQMRFDRSGASLVNRGTITTTGTADLYTMVSGQTFRQESGSLSPAVNWRSGTFGYVGGTMTGTAPVQLYQTALVFEPESVVPEGTTARFETSGSSTLAGDVPAGAVIKQLGGSGDELYAAADFVNRGTIQLGGTSGFNATLQVEGTLLNRGLIHGLAETSPVSMYVLRLENEGTLQADRQMRFDRSGASLVNRGTITTTGTADLYTMVSGQTFRQESGSLSPAVNWRSGTFGYVGGTMTGTAPVQLYQTALVFEPESVVPEGTTARFETSGSSTLAGDVPAGAVIKQLGGSGDELYAAADFVNRGTIQLGGTSGFDATLQSAGTVLNRGVIQALDEISPTRITIAALDNQGLLDLDQDTAFSGSLTGSTDGVLRGGTFDLAGALSGAPLGMFTGNEATLILRPGGTLRNGSSTDALASLASNAGTLTVTDGRTFAVGSFTNTGAVTVDPGSTLAASQDYVQAEGTTVLPDPTSTLSAAAAFGGVRVQGGMLTGVGTASGGLTAEGGSVDPGAEGVPGVLQVTGDYTQTPTGRLDVYVAGPTAGTGHDGLTVSGNATVDGTIGVQPADGFSPPAGEQYVVVDATGVTGGFAQADPDDFNGLHYVPGTNATQAYLEVVRGPYTVDVVKAGDGFGDVYSDDGGIACNGDPAPDCSEAYPGGTEVTLRAQWRTSSSQFDRWEGAPECGVIGICTFTASEHRTVTAVFSLRPFPLTVAPQGTGTGNVVSDPAGIDCGDDCTEEYLYGATVTLTATPSADSDFVGWDVTECPGTGPCTLTVQAAQTVRPTFELKTYPVTVTPQGDGAGTVASDLPGIDCGADCSETYTHGTTVTLTATPAPGSTFTGWGVPACPGTGPCTLTVTATQALTPSFVLQTFALTVDLAGTGAGTVTSDPAGIDCGTDCAETLPYGTVVTLTATPGANSVFDGWAGACTGTGTCTVTIDQARSVTATFTLQLPNLQVTAASMPPARAAAGDTFTVDDTTRNVGTGDAAATVTRFHLSTDGLLDAGDVLTGERSVPALAAGVLSSGATTVTIPLDTPDGVYQLLVCADAAAAVTEADEADNCRVAGTVTVDATQQVAVASGFDTDAQGWTVSGDPVLPAPTHEPAGGNPGGYLSVTDDGSGATLRWVAPAAYLGDQSAAYGGSLTFDLAQSTTDNQVAGTDDVLLSGGGLTLVFDTDPVPGTGWTRYEAPLLEGAGWIVQSTGGAATEAELRQVLADVTGLSIRAEFDSTGGDVDRLDTVVLYAPVPPPTPDLVVTDVRAAAREVTAGDRFDVDTLIANVGTGLAGPSRVTFALSTDALADAGDVPLIGDQRVDGFDADLSSRPPVTSLQVPSSVTPGSYWLLACADADGTVVEFDETNNCTASPRQLVVTAPVGDVQGTGGGTATTRPPRSGRNTGGTATTTDTTGDDGEATTTTITTRATRTS